MNFCRNGALALSTLSLLCITPAASFAAGGQLPIFLDGLSFESHEELHSSSYFKTGAGRCATPSREVRQALYPEPPESVLGSDCSSSSTNPTDIYEPGVNYEIQVVVHVIAPSTSISIVR